MMVISVVARYRKEIDLLPFNMILAHAIQTFRGEFPYLHVTCDKLVVRALQLGSAGRGASNILFLIFQWLQLSGCIIADPYIRSLGIYPDKLGSSKSLGNAFASILRVTNDSPEMAANTISPEDLPQPQEKPKDSSNIDPKLHDLPTLSRWYIDSRNWEARGLELPLLETLRPAEQEAVKRYYHAADRRMSLASHLLKYLYIHHACDVPWKDIVFSRTAPPEHRPYYDSPSSTKVEFNVSHQASMTILAGTIAPGPIQLEKLAAAGVSPLVPRLGIDITCVNERKPIKTFLELREYVDIFSEVFSPSELNDMRNPQLAFNRAGGVGLAKSFISAEGGKILDEDGLVRFGLRLFYSYWALKEAYVKLTGEALLAPWLRELEFTNVVPPDPVNASPAPRTSMVSSPETSQNSHQWGPPYTGVIVSKNGHRLKDIRIELVAFESDYIVATAGYGSSVGALSNNASNGATHNPHERFSSMGPSRIPLSAQKVVGDTDPWNTQHTIVDPWLPMHEVDVELDVRLCAEGRCGHSTGHTGGLSGHK